MRSPALALGWELWARHRLGLSGVGAGAVASAVLAQILRADSPSHTLGNVAPLLTFFVFIYLLSIFVYAEGTLGGKAAGFPPRLFTLPIRTSSLVAWPMLYGTLTVALLWLWLSALILVPCGLAQTVTWWPALLLATLLSWFQAVCWTLVRSPLLRLVVAVLGLPSVVLGVVLIWVRFKLEVTLTQVVVGLCALIGLAYAVAVAGVARDRRGDRLSWAWLGRLSLRAVPRWPSWERSLASPLAAQRWLEVRRHAWLLPMFVGFFLAFLFWAIALPLDPVDVARCAAAVIGVPLVLAFVIGFGMGKSSFWARDLQLPAFIATRPLASAALADAKLYAAALSALATWGLVLLLSPLWAVLSGNVAAIRALGEALLHEQPAWKLALLAPVALVGLVGLTWLQLVAGMCLSLTGRAWVVNAVVLLYGAVGTALAGLGLWTGFHADFFDTLLIVLWSLGGGLALLKLSAAVWTWRRVTCWRGTDCKSLLYRRTVACLAVWLGIATCLLVPIYAVVPETPVPTHLIALFVLLALPFTRLVGLPAAVAWNRHR